MSFTFRDRDGARPWSRPDGRVAGRDRANKDESSTVIECCPRADRQPLAAFLRGSRRRAVSLLVAALDARTWVAIAGLDALMWMMAVSQLIRRLLGDACVNKALLPMSIHYNWTTGETFTSGPKRWGRPRSFRAGKQDGGEVELPGRRPKLPARLPAWTSAHCVLTYARLSIHIGWGDMLLLRRGDVLSCVLLVDLVVVEVREGVVVGVDQPSRVHGEAPAEAPAARAEGGWRRPALRRRR